MIFTTYFANIKNLPNHIVPISIAKHPPKGYKGLEYKKLAPSTKALVEYKRDHNAGKYKRIYYEEILNKLDCHEVVRELNNMVNGYDVALVCYESPSDFCHRHIVSEWLNANGYLSTELYKITGEMANDY